MQNQNPPPIAIAAVVLVEENEKILLIQEAKAGCRNAWSLPGGIAGFGESIAEAAVREAQEESGLHIHLTGLFYADQLVCSTATGAGRIRFVFLGRAAGGTLKQTEDEHSIRAGWFSDAEIGRLVLRSPFVRKVIGIRRGDPAFLPMAKVHALTPEEMLLERP